MGAKAGEATTARARDGSAREQIVNADGEILVADLRGMTRSPDRKWIVALEFDPGADRYRTVLIDGPAARLDAILPLDGQPTLLPARWSPDNRRVAFVVAESREFAIYSLDVDARTASHQLEAGAVRRLHAVDSGRMALPSGAWSPDGRALAFVSGTDAVTAIYRIRLAQPPAVERVADATGSFETARVFWEEGMPAVR